MSTLLWEKCDFSENMLKIKNSSKLLHTSRAKKIKGLIEIIKVLIEKIKIFANSPFFKIHFLHTLSDNLP